MMDKDGWLPDEDEDQCAILMREELKPNWQCPGVSEGRMACGICSVGMVSGFICKVVEYPADTIKARRSRRLKELGGGSWISRG